MYGFIAVVGRSYGIREKLQATSLDYALLSKIAIAIHFSLR
jgi:hypothetical protein